MITCKLIADDREKKPKKAINSSIMNIKTKRMSVGDYACSCGMVGFERKELDFSNVAQVLRQSEELNQAYEHSYLVVTYPPSLYFNSGPIASTRAKARFIGSLCVRNKVPLFLPNDYEIMFEVMMAIIDKHHDGKSRGTHNFNSVRHVRNKDMQLNILTSLPGISTVRAKAILMKFGTVYAFLTATPKEQMSVDGVGKGVVSKINLSLGKIILTRDA